jgi:hypothetical protein
MTDATVSAFGAACVAFEQLRRPACGGADAALVPLPRPTLDLPTASLHRQLLAAARAATASPHTSQRLGEDATENPVSTSAIADLTSSLARAFDQFSPSSLATSAAAEDALSWRTFGATSVLDEFRASRVDGVVDAPTAARQSVVRIDTLVLGADGHRIKSTLLCRPSHSLRSVAQAISCARAALPQFARLGNDELVLRADVSPTGAASVSAATAARGARSRKQAPADDDAEAGSEPMTTGGVLSLDVLVDELVVGAMYVFRHLDDCDHPFVVSHCERAPSAEPLDAIPDDKPLRVYMRRARSETCDTCGVAPARVAVYACRLCPDHPSIFCHTCLELLHAEVVPGDDDECVCAALCSAVA